MTRYEFALMLAQRLGLVGAAATGRQAAQALMDEGLSTTTHFEPGAGSFNGNSIITRAEAATFLARASGVTISGANWKQDALDWAVDNGVFSSVGDPDQGWNAAWNDPVFTAAKPLFTVGAADTTTDTTTTPEAKGAVVTGGGTSTTTGGGTDVDLDIRDRVRDTIIAEYGLLPGDIDRDDLDTFVNDALAGDWDDMFMAQEFAKTKTYQNRFGIILDGFAARGEAPPSAEEMLDFEIMARATFRRAGYPEGFWDSRDEIHEIYGAGVFIPELQERLRLGWTEVQAAPIEVRTWYAQKYGRQGDAVFAANVVDPNYSEADLERMLETAQVGGAGHVYGFTLSEQLAGQLADYGVTHAAGLEGFQTLQQLAPLFSETFGETEDYTWEEQGIQSVFRTGGTGFGDLQRRARSRLAAFSGGGGALANQTGVLGLGTAE